MTKKIKILLEVESNPVDAWIFDLIVKLIAEEHCELLIVNHESDNSESSTQKRSIDKSIYKVFWRLYKKLVMRKTHLPSHTDKIPLSQLENQACLLAGSPQLHEEIKKQDFDVQIVATPSFERTNINTTYGTWWLLTSSRLNSQYPFEGYWEIVNGKSVSTCYVATTNQSGLNGSQQDYLSVIAESTAPVKTLSIEDTVRANYWNFPPIVCSKIRQLRLLGPEGALNEINRIPVPEDITHNDTVISYPSAISQAYFLTSSLIKKTVQLYRNWRTFEQWILLLARHNKDYENLAGTISVMETIAPPEGSDWADPHIIEAHGKCYIFFEECRRGEDKGIISAFSIDAEGKLTPPETVLERDYHLSFPFVFEHEGQFYMIPETSGSRRIELYRAHDFPNNWQLEKVLMDNVSAVDTTLMFKDGKWWMFTNISEGKGQLYDNHLYIYFSDDFLSGHWTPHPMNPVVNDCRSARQAGKVFEHDGQLVRPSQDCSVRYGFAINFNVIEKLDEQVYKETLIKKVSPEAKDGFLAHHSYTAMDNLVLIDAIQRRKLSTID